jgi:hypothetical protein
MRQNPLRDLLGSAQRHHLDGVGGVHGREPQLVLGVGVAERHRLLGVRSCARLALRSRVSAWMMVELVWRSSWEVSPSRGSATHPPTPCVHEQGRESS